MIVYLRTPAGDRPYEVQTIADCQIFVWALSTFGRAHCGDWLLVLQEMRRKNDRQHGN